MSVIGEPGSGIGLRRPWAAPRVTFDPLECFVVPFDWILDCFMVRQGSYGNNMHKDLRARRISEE